MQMTTKAAPPPTAPPITPILTPLFELSVDEVAGAPLVGDGVNDPLLTRVVEAEDEPEEGTAVGAGAAVALAPMPESAVVIGGYENMSITRKRLVIQYSLELVPERKLSQPM